MQTYLSVLEELKEITEQQTRSWNWLRFWQKSKAKKSKSPNAIPEEEALIEQTQDTEVPKDPPNLVLQKQEMRQWRATAPQEATKQGLYARVLRVVRFLERDDGLLPSIHTCDASSLLIIFSSFCFQSRHWSLPVCSVCFHTCNTAILPALERRVGAIVLHAGLFYDHRRCKHYWVE